MLLSYGRVLLLQVRRGRSAAVGGNGSRESSRRRRSSSASKQKERRALAVSSRRVMQPTIGDVLEEALALAERRRQEGELFGRVVRLADWLAERPHRPPCSHMCVAKASAVCTVPIIRLCRQGNCCGVWSAQTKMNAALVSNTPPHRVSAGPTSNRTLFTTPATDPTC